MALKRVLFVLFVCLPAFSLGCESKEFKAERLLWRAHKMAQDILKNPKGTPRAQWAKAQDLYRSIIKTHPGSLSATQSRFALGHLYMAQGEFQKARGEYEKIVEECGRRRTLCAEGLFAVSNSYEREGRWEDALRGYKDIMREYAFSAKALGAPLHIIRHHKRAKDEAAVRASVSEAVAYYGELKGKTRAAKNRYILDRFITRAYTEGGRWQEALDALEKTVQDYPQESPEEAILLKAMIYNDNLKDPARAEKEFLRIIRDYPASKLAAKINGYLKERP